MEVRSMIVHLTNNDLQIVLHAQTKYKIMVFNYLALIARFLNTPICVF